MFGLATLGDKLIWGAVYTLAIAAGVAWFTHSYDTGQAAKSQFAAASVAIKQIKHEAALAQSEGAAGQAIADEADKQFAIKQAKQSTTTKTLISEIPHFIAPNPVPEAKPDAPVPASQPDSAVGYSVPCGLLRLHDAAASGIGDPSDLPICAGKPDDAASDVDLSQFANVLIDNYGAFENNREQLSALQDWARQVALWYANVAKQYQASK